MPASHRGGGGVRVASDIGVVYPCGVSAAAAATAKNYDGKDEGEKLELKESQTSEAAQKAQQKVKVFYKDKASRNTCLHLFNFAKKH